MEIYKINIRVPTIIIVCRHTYILKHSYIVGCAYVRMHAHSTNTHTYANPPVQEVHTYIHIQLDTHTFITPKHIDSHIYIYIFIYVFMYVFVHIHIYLYIDMEIQVTWLC